MKKYLIISAHPNQDSFTQAIVKTLLELFHSRNIEVHHEDLYQKNFQCVLSMDDFKAWSARALPKDVLEQQALMHAAEKIIFVYPIWWYDAPAILKGWFDRIFTYGFAFHVTAEGPQGLLHGKKALVFQNVGGTEEAYSASGHIALVQDTMKAGRLGWSGISTEVETLFEVGSRSRDHAYHQALLAQVKERAMTFIDT
jgi:NAD(P)H dehydrogenase (quinone)